MSRFLMFSVLSLCSFAVVPTYALASNPAPTCSLLKAETATSLYGSPVTLGNTIGAAGGGMAVCLFVNAKKSEAVSLMVQNLPKGMESTIIDAVAKGDAGNKVVPVSGLGERAMFKIDSTAVTLAVFVHGKMVVLGVNGADSPARRAALTSVARDIVGRL